MTARRGDEMEEIAKTPEKEQLVGRRKNQGGVISRTPCAASVSGRRT